MAGANDEVRRSESAAKQVMEALVPPEHRSQVYGAIAGAIRQANAVHPGRWGVRVDPKNVMLKVGPIEVLQVLPEGLHLVIWRPGERRREASRGARYSRTAGTYISVPGSAWRDFDWDELPRAYEKVRSSHLKLIEVAAGSRRHPSTKSTHSPGFVQFLSRAIKGSLPQPDYLGADASEIARLPEEILADEEYSEGEVVHVLVRRAERDPKARAACLRKFGYACVGCGRTMVDRYGPRGKDVIHVHHLIPLSETSGHRDTVPKRDLRPVCPNCHAIIHAARPQLSIQELQDVVGRFGS